ncbi:MAG: transposase zinc-binding domain-containing protein [Gammaproteobacteria bacterium]|nr:transposase zinc-binding domain-containing protein [Gammaproteobacteria bacterium]
MHAETPQIHTEATLGSARRAADATHGREAAGGLAYARHRPGGPSLPAGGAALPGIRCVPDEQGRSYPRHVERKFEAYLKLRAARARLLRVRCESCHFERLVAFGCKKRGFCPSCGARRMAETAALLADECLPALPCASGWSASPSRCAFSLPSRPEALAKALEVIYRLLVTHLAHKAGVQMQEVATGAVTLVQRFGSALNLKTSTRTCSAWTACTCRVRSAGCASGG